MVNLYTWDKVPLRNLQAAYPKGFTKQFVNGYGFIDVAVGRYVVGVKTLAIIKTDKILTRLHTPGYTKSRAVIHSYIDKVTGFYYIEQCHVFPTKEAAAEYALQLKQRAYHRIYGNSELVC